MKIRTLVCAASAIFLLGGCTMNPSKEGRIQDLESKVQGLEQDVDDLEKALDNLKQSIETNDAVNPDQDSLKDE